MRDSPAIPASRKWTLSVLAVSGLVLSAIVTDSVARQAPPVVAAAAERAPIVREVRLTGTVTSPRVASVSVPVAGLVAQVHVDSGDRVAAGAPLVSLDRELEALALRRERAAVKEAEARLDDARRRLAEARRLAEDRNIPETEVSSRAAAVRIEAAAVERLRVAAEHQAGRVERHRVRAPFAGVISRKQTAAGEWVDPGDALVELVAVDGLRLDFQAPQAYYPRIDATTPVTVAMEALPDGPVRARIGATIPVSDPRARTFTVRVHPERTDLPITPGMSANATLRLATGREGVVVPRDALVRYPDGRVTVWTMAGEDGAPTVQERQVETGLTFAGRVEIRSGIEAGERVVTRGNEALADGQQVRLQEGE